MNELSIFAVQLLIALSASIFVLALIKPYLKDVLKDTCGTEHSAEFWVRFTQLMMVIAPLVIVIFFAGLNSNQQMSIQLVYIIKQTLLQVLFGELVGLAFVGRIIYRAINTTLEFERADIKQLNQTQENTVKV